MKFYNSWCLEPAFALLDELTQMLISMLLKLSLKVLIPPNGELWCNDRTHYQRLMNYIYEYSMIMMEGRVEFFLVLEFGCTFWNMKDISQLKEPGYDYEEELLIF